VRSKSVVNSVFKSVFINVVKVYNRCAFFLGVVFCVFRSFFFYFSWFLRYDFLPFCMQFEDFSRLILASLRLPQVTDDSCFEIGSFDARGVGEAVIPAMDSWVKVVDRRLDILGREQARWVEKYNIDAGQTMEKYRFPYIQAMQERMFTFKEYQLVFSEKVKESYIPAFRVFEQLMIENEQQRGFYIAMHEPHVQDYIHEISTSASQVSTFFEKKIVTRIPKSALKRHLYLIAKSGSGKSELLKTIFYHLQKESQDKQQHSQVVMEPHGDLVEEILRFHLNREKKERMIYIDVQLDPHNKRIPIINPFDMMQLETTQDVDIFTQQLVNAFEELSEDTKFTDRMKGVMRACISVLLMRKGSTLLDLLDFMLDREDLIALGKHSYNVVYRKLFRELFTTGDFDNTKKAIYSKIYTLLSSGSFADVVLGEKSTIDLEGAINSGKIILLNLSQSKLGDDGSPALGCFVMALLRTISLKRANIPKHLRKPTYVFIDEAQNYLSKSLNTILAECRKYGLHLIISHQHLGQILNKELKESLLANSMIKIVGETNHASFQTMGKEMNYPVDHLNAMKKYHFTIKIEDREAFEFSSPSKLLFDSKKPSKYYLTDKELKGFKGWLLYDSGYYVPRRGESSRLESYDLPTYNPETDVNGDGWIVTNRADNKHSNTDEGHWQKNGSENSYEGQKRKSEAPKPKFGL